MYVRIMLLAFYVHNEIIEPLGFCDTDLSGFFFSPKFRDLCQELLIPRFKSEEYYSKYKCYLHFKPGMDKILYLVNTEIDLNGDVLDRNHYKLITKAIRDFKISQLI